MCNHVWTAEFCRAFDGRMKAVGWHCKHCGVTR